MAGDGTGGRTGEDRDTSWNGSCSAWGVLQTLLLVKPKAGWASRLKAGLGGQGGRVARSRVVCGSLATVMLLCA